MSRTVFALVEPGLATFNSPCFSAIRMRRSGVQATTVGWVRFETSVCSVNPGMANVGAATAGAGPARATPRSVSSRAMRWTGVKGPVISLYNRLSRCASLAATDAPDDHRSATSAGVPQLEPHPAPGRQEQPVAAADADAAALGELPEALGGQMPGPVPVAARHQLDAQPAGTRAAGPNAQAAREAAADPHADPEPRPGPRARVVARGARRTAADRHRAARRGRCHLADSLDEGGSGGLGAPVQVVHPEPVLVVGAVLLPRDPRVRDQPRDVAVRAREVADERPEVGAAIRVRGSGGGPADLGDLERNAPLTHVSQGPAHAADLGVDTHDAYGVRMEGDRVDAVAQLGAVLIHAPQEGGVTSLR